MGIVSGTSPSAGNIGVSTSPNQAATYNGQNIIIPNAAAGIGDIVLKNNSTSACIVMAGETYAATPSGYTLMGVIYGWEGGSAMVVAPTGESKHWLAHGSSGTDLAYNSSYTSQATLPGGYNTTGTAGSPRRRDGISSWCAIMNIARFNAWRTTNATQPDATDPLGATYTSWPSKAKFEAATAVKNKYGTYEKYMSVAKPFGAGDGSCFSRKWHVGKANTAAMGTYTSSNLHSVSVSMNGTTYTGVWYPAARYCYSYGAGGGLYWLPDMHELRLLMSDDTLAKVNEALKKCGSQIDAVSTLWSSVRYSAADAWYYSGLGFSYNDRFGYSLHARPVTLLKI